MNAIFTLHRLTKRLQGGREIFSDVSLSFLPGAKIGVLGQNGAGKSTLMRIIAGEDKNFEGDAQSAPNATIGHLTQEPELEPTKTVKEVVEEAVKDTIQVLKKFEEVSNSLATCEDDETMMSLLDEQASLQETIDAQQGWDLSRKLEIAMDALNCPSPDALVSEISGGERRRVALCRLLIAVPDILLLDEPTNHLDAVSVSWLERHLRDYKGTVIIVTHDRYFLDNVTGWILEIGGGKCYPFKGNYSSWLENKESRLKNEEQSQSIVVKQLARERDWIGRTLQGGKRHTTARVKSYNDLLEQAKRGGRSEARIVIPPGPRLGSKVLEVSNLTLKNSEATLINNLSLSLKAGEILGIIGANGAGKTTFLRAIAGLAKPDGGEIELGQSVNLGYVGQLREGINPDNSVWQIIADEEDSKSSYGDKTIKLGAKDISLRAYAASFGFRGSDQQQKAGSLSGGERNRLNLARLLIEGHNLLLLDEPTNDLDIDTLRTLEEALDDFAGSAVIVSHDRWFLDRIATSILAFEEDATQHLVIGGYQNYVEDRKRRFGSKENNTSKKHKQLVR